MTRLTRHLILSAVLFTAVPCPAQEAIRASSILENEDAPRPPRNANNAAWSYYKAWDTLTNEDRQRSGELLAGMAKDQRQLSKEQREELARQRDYIDGVLQASAMDVCDWGSRTDKGFMALLPHLGHLRQSARTLAMDARRCAEDGNSMAAAERVVALYRIGRHASTDRFLISSLVGTAVSALATNLTNEFLRSDRLTPAAARLILTEMRKVDRSDPWNAFSSIDLERRLTLESFRRDWSGPDAPLRFGRALAEVGSLRGEGRWPEFLNMFILSMNEQRIQAEIDRADRYFDALKAAWQRPNAAVALDELELQVAELQWGLVTRVAGAAFATTRRTIDRALDQMDQTAARLRVIIEETPKEPAR